MKVFCWLVRALEITVADGEGLLMPSMFKGMSARILLPRSLVSLCSLTKALLISLSLPLLPPVSATAKGAAAVVLRTR